MKVSILGCTGRMGRTVIVESIKDKFFEVTSGYCREDDNFLGFDLGEIAAKYSIGIKSSSNLSETIEACDVVIDFTSPALTMSALAEAVKYKKIFISGTTGLSDEEHQKLISSGSEIPVIWSSNMSIGINLLNILVAKAAAMLGDEYDSEIVEMHHKRKKDSPSGTAITLGKKIAEAKQIDFNENACFKRFGIIGERAKNEIGFATVRGGSIVGDHNVIFAGENDQIELNHRALNRNIFARGALHAAKWAIKQNPGYYTMQDVLKDN